MTSQGVPVLSDFGISRVIAGSQTITGTSSLRGCVTWMASELLNPSAYSHGPSHQLHTKSSDVWAFGMILYVS